MIKTVSTKDLRLNMKDVKNSLKNGVSIVWIDHSQPIAKIVPIDSVDDKGSTDWLERMKKLRFSVPGKKKIDAVELIRKERV
jgi:antitoxin (DNA-binding transcriptional repressor) of toxin-antitoxin stability system